MDGWSDLFISDNIEQQQFNWNMNGKEKGSRKTTTTDEKKKDAKINRMNNRHDDDRKFFSNVFLILKF